MIGPVISRFIRNFKAFNTVNVRKVKIHFQMSPGIPSGDDRGIAGLDFKVFSGSTERQKGKSGKDGEIEVEVIGGEAILKLYYKDSPVAEYNVSICDEPLTPENTLKGQQQRLRMLGYQLGHNGEDKNGVDGTKGKLTECAILDFQADSDFQIDGIVGPKTRSRLKKDTGG